ncbi:MAG: heme-dependent oxidative N-demethylase family protein [Roseicyclus sp.]
MLHTHLPNAPWTMPAQRRLPGIQPLQMGGWLIADEAYPGQMALRDRLIAERRAAVHAEMPGAGEAAAETLKTVLAHLPPGFLRAGDRVTRPDGVTVDLGAEPPLVTAGRLVQEDLCLLEKPQGAAEHVLTAAILCFPASWTLAEKIGRPLAAIHIPVAQYDAEMAARVQRLFDGIRPGRPLWRQNALFYGRPDLFAPRPEAEPRVVPRTRPAYLRSERQCLVRLPETGAVVFSIHTYVLPIAALTPAQIAALEEHPVHYAGRVS